MAKVRITRNTDEHATLVALITACDLGMPVTISYLEKEKDDNGRETGNLVEVVRTIEIYGFRTTKGSRKAPAGELMIKAMDRDGYYADIEEGKEQPGVRNWNLTRITGYTIHRHAHYTIQLPEEVYASLMDAAIAEQYARAELATTAELIEAAMWADLDTNDKDADAADDVDMDPAAGDRDFALAATGALIAA